MLPHLQKPYNSTINPPPLLRGCFCLAMSTQHAYWASSRIAADALAVSEKTLYRWRCLGLLKPGIHWRRKFPATNSPLLYDLHAVEAVMREVTARDPRFLEMT